MRVQGLGVTASGVQGLDTGLRDLVWHTTVQGNFLIAHSGRNGGFVTYQVAADGALMPVATRFYGLDVTLASGRGLSIAQFNGETVAFFGSNINELVGYRIEVNGSFGPVRRATWAPLESQIAAGGTDLLTAWTLLSSRVPPALPGGAWHLDTAALVPLSVGGTPFLLATSPTTQEVLSFRVNPGGAPASPADRFGADELLGINTPVAMQTLSFLGMSFAVIAGSGSSSLSVLRVGADGSLTPTDHVLDTLLSRFDDVQALATATVGDHAFVVAAGGDHGVTLFRLLPDGRLMFVDAIADRNGLGLHNVISLAAAVQGGNLVIYAGSQRDAGVTRLQVDLGALGSVVQARADIAVAVTGGAGRDVLQARSSGDSLFGGGGDDILISGPGEVAMLGGGGGDTFVIRAQSTLVRVQDFERGLDRLELSHLPMLRNPGQLTFTPLANGAEIVYRGTRIILTASNGAPLSMQDIFPRGFDWTDRAFFMDLVAPPPPPPPPALALPPPPPPPPPGGLTAPPGGGTVIGTGGNDSIQGSESNDTLEGRDGDDLINGRGGHDTLSGGAGQDRLFGGEGRDLIHGGIGADLIHGDQGNDTLHGDQGNDTLFGGDGDDLIFGGSENDVLHGDLGDDTLHGDEGDDSLYGGEGRDHLFGGIGADSLWGGHGVDRLWGGEGDDLLYAGEGADRLWGGAGDDDLYGEDGNDFIYGEDGNDRLFGGRNNDELYGGLGDDRLFGGTQDDLLLGEDGNDRLYGDGGHDTLFGGNGADRLWGGRGADRLDGGPGNDRMWGNDGSDVFVFAEGYGRDQVMDFSAAQGDRIELNRNLWTGALSAAQVVTQFGVVAGSTVELRFSSRDILVIEGMTTLAGLAASIDIV